MRKIRFIALATFLLPLIANAAPPASVPASHQSTVEFAPAADFVKPTEQPYRQSVCLNGEWQFEPIALPDHFAFGKAPTPDLPEPTSAWSPVPIKIPSPWNVNTWGGGRPDKNDPIKKYWPDSVYFPSYPPEWDATQMGWLRRSFTVPKAWAGKRIVLHFEAVAGDCQVRVNGKPVGEHFDAYLPFDLDITSAIKPGQPNELLVGVRSRKLFDIQSKQYAKMHAPYPCGSDTSGIVGIWQDVFLLALPPTRVDDAFVQPFVSKGELNVDVTLRNDSDAPSHVAVQADIAAWKNEVDPLTIAEATPHGSLGPVAMQLPSATVDVPAHGTQHVMLHRAVREGELKYWTPDSPNLYVAGVTVSQNGQQVDRKDERFGWREFKIAGTNLLLNGKKIQLCGDLLHPFGPFILSRSYTWAWYKMIKDFGGNSVRPHAQIHPRHYLDLADEMGLVVIDETAIFGSSVALNFEPEIAWKRFADHYDGLIVRDRNHPSVFGWSVGNELFAIFNLNKVSKEDADRWYPMITQLAMRAKTLDPTRDWLSCDGDGDLRGTLPTYSRHFGLGLPLDRLPTDTGKPIMVGESGGSYYASPKQLSVFNGDAAYGSYAMRNDAIGIDLYDNIVHMAKPLLAYFSASETAWFGVSHLNFGYDDFSRLPNETDGIWFTAPFKDGKPGIQPERLPPYVATLNPGWDPALPVYKPLGMFEAEKAALDPRGPQACQWDHKSATMPSNGMTPASSVSQAAFVGDAGGTFGQRCKALGVPIASDAKGFVIVDADSLAGKESAAKSAIDAATAAGGTAFVFSNHASSETLSQLLPAAASLVDRRATGLAGDASSAVTASLSLADLSYVEEAEHPVLQKAIDGPILTQAKVLLQAGEEDWSFFRAPERSKCAALVLYEQLKKPSGAALVEMKVGSGRVLVCTINLETTSAPADATWRSIFAGLGLKLGAKQAGDSAAFSGDTLLRALVVGPVKNGNPIEQAVAGNKVADKTWAQRSVINGDRIVFDDLVPAGAPAGGFVQISYWVNSPRSTDNLLADGPDAPKLNQFVYATGGLKMSVNGKVVAASHSEPADTRMMFEFDALALQRGWNHFVLVVPATHDGNVAVRLASENAAFLNQLDTAVQQTKK